MGKFHAEKYASLHNCNLKAVADIQSATAQSVAEQFDQVKASTDYMEIVDHVDAVSIVTSTPSHYTIAKNCLARGKHVLLEKPMTSTVEQAQELIDLAQQNNCVLQIGHIERFNPVVLAMDENLQTPRFIESHRLSPFRLRGTDVNVVLDLMIHDIDIILSIVNADIDSIHASGMSILSNDIDIANARISFDNQCVANVTASRVSDKTERKLRVFQENAYFSADLGNHSLKMHTRKDQAIESQSFEFEKQDALHNEIQHFVHCIQTKSQPLVRGIDGLRALRAADQISKTMQVHYSKVNYAEQRSQLFHSHGGFAYAVSCTQTGN